MDKISLVIFPKFTGTGIFTRPVRRYPYPTRTREIATRTRTRGYGYG